jgi:hypothetical protein
MEESIREVGGGAEGMSTAAIKLALRAKYPLRDHAVLWEVGNSTGQKCTRHADCVVMSLWPSRGLEVIGIEIKSSRSDWQKELVEPAKADSIFRYCDRWFLAVSDDKIVRHGELPANWGLMVLNGDKLIAKTSAAPLAPVPLDRGFVAAMLRRASENAVDAAEIAKAVENALKVGKKTWQEEEARNIKAITASFDELKNKVHEFEQASGIHISDRYRLWDSRKVGEAVKMVLAGQHLRPTTELQSIRYTASHIVEMIDSQLESLQQADNTESHNGES